MPSADPSIADILHRAAGINRSVIIYDRERGPESFRFSYNELLLAAKVRAKALAAHPSWSPSNICIICMNGHRNHIVWLWSVIEAGGIPVMFTKVPPADRLKQLSHLKNLFGDPVCLTDEQNLQHLKPLDLRMPVICGEEQLRSHAKTDKSQVVLLPSRQDPALLMLTSGSSGTPKAVAISHEQIFASIWGKSETLPCPEGTTILNWVGLDHVGGLLEAHFRAMRDGLDQVHVATEDVVSDPLLYLRLMERHKACGTFCPNFLLAKIATELERHRQSSLRNFDLSSLRWIVSGGEACVTSTCQRVCQLLEAYGAQHPVVVPAFGMTETCAGCIYYKSGMQTLDSLTEMAPVGKPFEGIEMCILPLVSKANDDRPLVDGCVGQVHLRGPTVFQEYYGDIKNTREAFTQNGWFKTGDTGYIDPQGNLQIVGRSKESICINGTQYFPGDQEAAIEDERIPGVCPGRIVCFAWRDGGAQTEQCYIVYQHTYAAEDAQSRYFALRQISKVLLLRIGVRPKVLALPAGFVERTAIGKLSRRAVKTALEKGILDAEVQLNADHIDLARVQSCTPPQNAVEQRLLQLVTASTGLTSEDIGTRSEFLDCGITSVELIRLRQQIQDACCIRSLPVRLLMVNTTVESLASAIKQLLKNSSAPSYSPVIPLQKHGSRNPLWLVHPGVGEVLVFVNLAQQLHDRPVYALRARGFDQGEEPFHSIGEAVETYVNNIRAQQPQGPYAIAGYSYGSMLTFEISKRLIAQGQSVSFVGFLNLPPHIKTRMRQLTQNNCLINLGLFLGLIDNETSDRLEQELTGKPFDQCMHIVLSFDRGRIAQLGLKPEQVERWAKVAFSLQDMATDYEPSGHVPLIDVFYCEPLSFVASSKQQWLSEHLKPWKDFCETAPRFHEVQGGHYTMLAPHHVASFKKILENAMAARGA